MKRRIALLFTAAIAATLAGCATADPDPLGERQRSEIRASILRDGWARVERVYPDADPRPVVPSMHTVTDHARPAVLVACLRRNGIQATRFDAGYRYNPPYAYPVEFARLRFACSARYPAESQVIPHLGSSQRSELFRYRRDTVRTCLLSIGVPSPHPPPGAARPTDGIELPNWNPYQYVWQRELPPGPLALLERRCPPIPAWLDLSG